MNDPRFEKLATVLTGFSTSLRRGERVLIDAFDVPEEMVIALVRAARERGALPYVQLNNAKITRELLRGAEEDQYCTSATTISSGTSNASISTRSPRRSEVEKPVRTEASFSKRGSFIVRMELLMPPAWQQRPPGANGENDPARPPRPASEPAA